MDEFNLMVSEQSRMWGSRSKRTKNNALLVNGQAVEENEGLRPHLSWIETF